MVSPSSATSMITAIMPPPPATPSSSVVSNRPAVVQDHVLYFINRQIIISPKKKKSWNTVWKFKIFFFTQKWFHEKLAHGRFLVRFPHGVLKPFSCFVIENVNFSLKNITSTTIFLKSRTIIKKSLLLELIRFLLSPTNNKGLLKRIALALNIPHAPYNYPSCLVHHCCDCHQALSWPRCQWHIYLRIFRFRILGPRWKKVRIQRLHRCLPRPPVKTHCTEMRQLCTIIKILTVTSWPIHCQPIRIWARRKASNLPWDAFLARRRNIWG